MELKYPYQHCYIIGKSGTGKSTLMKQLIINDMEKDRGVLYIDPHGEDTDELLQYVPEHRRNDVIIYDPSDYDWPIPWNPFQTVPQEKRPFIASSMVDTFKSIWGYSIPTPTLDMYLYNTIAALLDMPNSTLMGIKYMLTSSIYRTRVLKHVLDPVVRDFWVDFEALPRKDKIEETRSTLNKISYLISDPHIRHSIGHPKSSFTMSDVLKGKIMFARLPQGRLGVQKSSVLGSLLLAQLHASALEGNTHPFHVYIDECHNFGTSSVVEMLSGIRKYNVSMTLANQFLDSLSGELRSAVLGTVGTKYVFRCSIKDVDYLQEEKFPSAHQLNELMRFRAREFLPDSTALNDISVDILPEPTQAQFVQKLKRGNRRKYAKPRKKIEASVQRFLDSV